MFVKQFEASNRVAYKIISLRITVVVIYLVKPDPVSELEVAESAVTANFATVTWKSPKEDRKILFRVSVRSSANDHVHVRWVLFSRFIY